LGPIRYHLDEQIPTAIGAGLKQRGVDVTTAADAGLIGAGDLEHLAFATTNQRVLVTHDSDFPRLHSLSPIHCGIAYCHQDKYAIGPLIQLLFVLHQCYSAAEMEGRVEFL
jgi:hypothetical protein